MPVVLHKTDGSPPCRAVFMTLEVINLKVDYVEVKTFAGETMKPEYLEKNPLHSVPLIEEGDFVLADSHAIITYLVSKYGAEKRSDLRTRALIDQRLHFDNGILYTRLLNAIKTMFSTSTPPTEEQMAGFEEAYGIMETYLRKSPYLVGDHPTLADISCVSTLSTINLLLPINGQKYPKLTDWFKRIEETSWYQKGNLKGLTDLAGLLKGGK